MNPITMLKNDHQKVSRLFEEHERAAAGRKRSIFEQINTELSVHAEIEEQVFYPAVREASRKGQETVKEGYEEHAEVKALLAELSAMDAEDDEYEKKIAELRQGVEHHVEEEEGEMLPEAERALGARLNEVGDRMAEMKESLVGGEMGAAVTGRRPGRSAAGGSRAGGARRTASGSRARSRSGSSRGGTSRARTSRSGASRSGSSRSGSSRGGASRSGAARGGASRSGSSRGGASRAGARGGTARRKSTAGRGRSTAGRARGRSSRRR